VILVATAGLCVLFGVSRRARESWRAGAVAGTGIVGSGLVGLLLAAPVAVPLFVAVRGSFRSIAPNPLVANAWSLHPAMLLETVAPHLFTDPLDREGGHWPLLAALNDGRDPYLYSIYLGIGALTLAVVAIGCGDRKSFVRFWAIVALASSILALGVYTPVLPALQQLVPQLLSLRSPSKYMVIAAFSLAPLVAIGWDALFTWTGESPRRRGTTEALAVAGSIAILAALAGLLLVWPGLVERGLHITATALGVTPVAPAVDALFESIVVTAPRLVALGAAIAGCVWIAAARPRHRALARIALFAAVAVDLSVTNSNLLPTMPVELLGRPNWTEITARDPHARVYLPGRSSCPWDRRSREPPCSRRRSRPRGAFASRSRTILRFSCHVSMSLRSGGSAAAHVRIAFAFSETAPSGICSFHGLTKRRTTDWPPMTSLLPSLSSS
jgi:hypothetical protein